MDGFSIFFTKLFRFVILVIEFKVEIVGVKLVQTDVTVFTATGVRLAVRMESQRIDGTEMALDATKFLFEYQMEETGIELADTSGRRCDVHGVLTTSEHHLNKKRENG